MSEPFAARAGTGPGRPGRGRQARCVGRRRLTVRVRSRKALRRVRSVRLSVSGKRVKLRSGARRRVRVRIRGRRLRARVDLRGVRAGRVKLRIVARTSAGKRVVLVKRFRLCARRAGS